ncbi:DUF2063 domain-containing protein [Pseudoalteromonas fenneropenaei]|uniref:DUF2063 domain-containing protein n=1 Tax=Pseudoalteromonas fenneropenaei TaxID=1737459 RepID=A0ABV7CIA9_9GAMM
MPDFIEVQKQFAAGIRTPSLHDEYFPELEARRLAIYQDLFFNNVSGFVSNAFPVLKSLYQAEDWQALLRDFFQQHPCHSPYFVDIAEEFLTYLTTSFSTRECDADFMLELAHYEWIELVVSVAMQDESEQSLTSTDLLDAKLYIATSARVLSYSYAVHQISTDFQPQAPSAERHYFVVYRDGEDDVQFMACNALTALLLDTLQQQPGINIAQLITLMQSHATAIPLAQLQQGAFQLLGQFAELGVVVTKNAQ